MKLILTTLSFTLFVSCNVKNKELPEFIILNEEYTEKEFENQYLNNYSPIIDSIIDIKLYWLYANKDYIKKETYVYFPATIETSDSKYISNEKKYIDTTIYEVHVILEIDSLFEHYLFTFNRDLTYQSEMKMLSEPITR